MYDLILFSVERSGRGGSSGNNRPHVQSKIHGDFHIGEHASTQLVSWRRSGFGLQEIRDFNSEDICRRPVQLQCWTNPAS